MINEIRFFIREEPYGFLSNFERTGFRASPNEWSEEVFYPTNEHFYHAQKANCEKVHDYIVAAPHARIAMVLGQQLESNKYLSEKYLVQYWPWAMLGVMLRGLRYKFKDEKLRQMLLDTGDAVLIEDNPEDRFWGIGNGTGSNWLGKLLMVVREECRGLSCADFGFMRCVRGFTRDPPKSCPVIKICREYADYMERMAAKYE